MSDRVINTWVRQVIGTSRDGVLAWVAVRVGARTYETEYIRSASEDMADQAFLAKHPGGTITERTWRHDPLAIDDAEDNEEN